MSGGGDKRGEARVLATSQVIARAVLDSGASTGLLVLTFDDDPDCVMTSATARRAGLVVTDEHTARVVSGCFRAIPELHPEVPDPSVNPLGRCLVAQIRVLAAEDAEAAIAFVGTLGAGAILRNSCDQCVDKFTGAIDRAVRFVNATALPGSKVGRERREGMH